MPLLQLEAVSKTYDVGLEPLTVLRDVDLTVQAGESLAVVGPSGSGKSTLLNLAAGLDKPTAGRVLLDGEDLSERSDQALSELRLHRMGFIFQQHHLLPQCTALENVLLPTLPLGTPKEARVRAQELLEAVGLTARMDHQPGQLSGGECSRVAVARALINEPALLYADEPTGSLDKEKSAAMTDLLLDLNQRYQTALIVVTHSEAVAEAMGRRVSLEAGRVAAP
ncbi:MAG: ABC transporter ATP-binding protein [Planctomycetota bacterium]|jgi:ABC-type lipoprotein export system ATPase subunit